MMMMMIKVNYKQSSLASPRRKKKLCTDNDGLPMLDSLIDHYFHVFIYIIKKKYEQDYDDDDDKILQIKM